jgi:hypothetical protein
MTSLLREEDLRCGLNRCRFDSLKRMHGGGAPEIVYKKSLKFIYTLEYRCELKLNKQKRKTLGVPLAGT